MRALHRDLGYLVLGLVVVYAVSGITLTYRDTDLFKTERWVEVKLEPNMPLSDIGQALRIREIKETSSEGDLLHFSQGTYNRATGEARYTIKELPRILHKFASLHKTASKNPLHWFTLVFSILLLFLGISSFWMFQPGTKLFRRGLLFTLFGVAFATILLLF